MVKRSIGMTEKLINLKAFFTLRLIISLILTVFIIGYWFLIGFAIALSSHEFGRHDESRISFYIATFPGAFLAIAAAVFLYRFYLKNKTIYYSPNIILTAFLIGCLLVIYQIPTILFFGKIPGFFPLYNNSFAIGLLKDLILTFSAIALIYAVLVAAKILIMKLFNLHI